VKNEPLVNLRLSLLGVKVSHLREQSLNFLLQVDCQVVLGEDWR
jgi:hypothetical protein